MSKVNFVVHIKKDKIIPQFKTRTVHFDPFYIEFHYGQELVHKTYSTNLSASFDGSYIKNPEFTLGFTYVFDLDKDLNEKPFFYISFYGMISNERFIIDYPFYFQEAEVFCKRLEKDKIKYVVLHVDENKIEEIAKKRIREILQKKGEFYKERIDNIKLNVERCFNLIKSIRETWDIKNSIPETEFSQYITNHSVKVKKLYDSFAKCTTLKEVKKLFEKIIRLHEPVALGICEIYNLDWNTIIDFAWKKIENHFK